MKIEKLLYEEESSTLDFKEEQYPFIGEENKHKKSELLKDILAFANAWRHSDAYILIGVREMKGSKNEVVGIEQDIDDASLQEFINQKTNKPINFEYKTKNINEKHIAYIKIPVQDRPFFIKKEYGKVKENTVYLRRGSSTAIADPTEISEMGESKVKNGNSIVDNPVDYKVVARISPIKIDKEKEISLFENKIELALKEIKQIEAIEDNRDYLYDVMMRSGEKKLSEYISELKNRYKIEIQDYIDKYSKEIKNLESYIEVFEEKKYFLKLSIENIGSKSDTNIDIRINIKNAFLMKEDEVYRDFQYEPSCPEKPSRNHTVASKVDNLMGLKDIAISNAYRQEQTISEKYISVILRDMNVGDNISLVKDKLFLDISELNLLNINLIIKSKESTNKIVKDVEILFTEEVQFFDILFSNTKRYITS